MSVLPTRSQVEAVLAGQKGNGRNAMEEAVRAMKPTYPDMTDDLINRIIDDLLSYTSYQNET